MAHPSNIKLLKEPFILWFFFFATLGISLLSKENQLVFFFQIWKEDIYHKDCTTIYQALYHVQGHGDAIERIKCGQQKEPRGTS